MTSIDQPAAKSRTRWGWVGALVAIAAGIGGIARGIDAFSLPACDSEAATTTVREIFAEKEVPLTTLANPALVSEAESERTCSATIATADEEGTITYRIYWDGWSKSVQIGAVDVRPIAAPAG